jgi:hypothetical protein
MSAVVVLTSISDSSVTGVVTFQQVSIREEGEEREIRVEMSEMGWGEVR